MPVSAIELDGAFLPLRVQDAPVELQLVDQLGNDLPASPPAFVKVSLPGYLAAPASISNGELPLYAKGAGTATVTITHLDATNGLITKVLTLTVYPDESGTYYIAWGPFALTWDDAVLTWE